MRAVFQKSVITLQPRVNPFLSTYKIMTDMKRLWILSTLCVAVLMAGLLVFASDGNYFDAGVLPEKKDITSIESQDEIPDNEDDFACKLFRTIIEQKGSDSSIVVSPISVGYLLGMLNEGAGGETRRQITNVLGLDGSVLEINKYFKKMMDDASKVDPKVTVKTANCIFFKSDEKLIPKYKADMQKYYDAQIEAINFNPSNIVQRINSWCKAHTDGMIPELVTKKELNPRAVMYLLNAVYFKANWAQEFDPDETRDKYFKKEDGTTVKHKMLHLKTHVAYGKNDLCKMLCLPYGNGSYSMVMLLPHKGKTIGNIIQSFTAKKLEQMRKQEMITREVDILMPRFATEYKTDLKDILSAMGMPLAFGGGNVEFPNMLQGHVGDLYVSMMKQKAKIEVNEEGTRAAAVTIAEMSELGGSFNSYTFHATRPFVYCIVENKTGTIYFMGTYCGEEGVKVDHCDDAEMEDCDEEHEIVLERPIEKPVEKPKEAKEEIFRSVEQMPQFPGGEAALMKHIKSQLNYPLEAAQNKIQGRVVIQFVVEKDGSIGEVKVVRSVDNDLDEEAVRLIKSLPKFIPGRHKGQPVAVWYTLPVSFKLP